MNKPIVFTDYHQTDLYHSFQLLFEKRLGGTCLRPIGMEWWTEGYWKLNNLEATAKQYLDPGGQPTDGTQPLNDVWIDDNHDILMPYYLIQDHHNKSTNKAITFETFKAMPIDIVIASIPTHIEPFRKLAQMKGAKFIFQAGNVFPEVQYNLLPNLMTNTMPEYPSSHTVQYHQNFDTSIFTPSSNPSERLITSFINVYQDNAGFEDYLTLKGMMTDFTFKSYGGQGMDGSIGTTQEMASIMQKSYFGEHSKRMGDGFGHVLYNWFACGKPIITRISDYKGKLGEELLTDMETCIDLDVHNYNEVQSIVSDMSPDKYNYMVQQVKNRFQSKVNFDEEEVKLREFVENLQ